MRHIETFIAENWIEHLRQHERVTLADRALEEELRTFQVGEGPVVTHVTREREDKVRQLAFLVAVHRRNVDADQRGLRSPVYRR